MYISKPTFHQGWTRKEKERLAVVSRRSQSLETYSLVNTAGKRKQTLVNICESSIEKIYSPLILFSEFLFRLAFSIAEPSFSIDFPCLATLRFNQTPVCSTVCLKVATSFFSPISSVRRSTKPTSDATSSSPPGPPSLANVLLPSEEDEEFWKDDEVLDERDR